jgi:hypothetical protein
MVTSSCLGKIVVIHNVTKDEERREQKGKGIEKDINISMICL